MIKSGIRRTIVLFCVFCITIGTCYIFPIEEKELKKGVHEDKLDTKDAWISRYETRIVNPGPVTVTTSEGALIVNWTQDVDSEDSPFYYYKVTRKKGSETTIVAKIFDKTETNFRDEEYNLTDGERYTYIVETIEGLGKPPNDPFLILSKESAEGSGKPLGDAKPPSAPEKVNAISSGDYSITLSWSMPKELDLRGYKIMRSSNSGGPYNEIANINNPNILNYNDSNLLPGTYFYVVCAYDEIPNYSQNSNEVSVKLSGLEPPHDVSIAVCPEGNALNLSWQISHQDIDGYKVYRALDNLNFEVVAQINNKSVSKYKDTNLQDGVTYYYSLTCYKGSIESEKTASVFATPADTLPPQPTTVYLEDHSSEGYVIIRWEKITDSDLEGIIVKRGTSSGVYDTEFRVSKYDISFYDNTILPGIVYYYVVCPYDEVPNIGVSNEVSGPDISGLPPVPINVVVSIIPEGNALNITWRDGLGNGVSSGIAESYNVYISNASGGEYRFLANTKNKFYLHTGLEDGIAYYYRISAKNSKGESAKSEEVFGIPKDSVPPGVPENLTIRKEYGFGLNLSWSLPRYNENNEINNINSDIAGYNIYRRSAEVGLELIATVPASQLFYNDSNLPEGKTYFYSVSSFDEVPNESPKSHEVSATVGLPSLEAPTGVTVSMPERNVTITWLGVNGAQSYIIYRRASYATGTNPIGNTTELSFIDTTALENNTYYYSVAAVDDLGVIGKRSEEFRFAVPDLEPLPPTGMYLTASEKGYLISWNPNLESDVIGYFVYRSTTPGGPYEEIAFVVWTDYEDVVSGSFYYVVRAVDSGGHKSENSEEVFTGNTYVAPPENVRISPSENGLELTWTKSRTYEVSEYRVYRSEMLYIGYEIVGRVPASKDKSEYKYLDKPTDRKVYYYYITAWDDFSYKESPPSQKVSGQILSGDSSVGNVTGLQIRDPGTGYSLILSWDPCAGSDIVYYRIYCTNSSSGILQLVGTTASTNYTHTGLKPGVMYYYEVVPVNAQNIEGKSANRVSAIPRDLTPPSTPQNVRVALVSSEDSETVDVVIRWSPSADEDVAGYKIFWSNDNISFQVLTTVDKNVTSFTHRGLERGKFYFYKVSAIDSVPNESPQSISAYIKTPVKSKPQGNTECMTFVFPAIVVTLIIIAILAALATRMESKKKRKKEEK
ncbi:MAG: fibronectin type III domain-containing protein [Thermoplasmata archaeon]